MNKLAIKILDTVEVGALATVNRDRTPLVTALHFARLEDMIIWVSDPTSRHAHNAFRTGKTEFVVWDEQKNAVFLTTTVREIVDEAELAAAQKAYAKKLSNFMPQVDRPQFYAMPIGQLDEKTTTENWPHFIA